MSRVLVLGAAGMLGHKMLQTLAAEGHDTVGTVRADLEDLGVGGAFLGGIAPILEGVDVTKPDSVKAALDSVEPDVVLNCAGIVKQRPSAQDAIASISVNALFPHQLAAMCKESDRRLIHFSTDCVFSGRRGSYSEGDESDALDLYGRTKYLGEVGNSALTIRTSIVGRELAGSQSLIEWFISQGGREVNGFTRAMYSGVTTLEASRFVERLITQGPELSGVYQLAGPAISKHDLLHLVNNAMDLGVTIVSDSGFVLDRTLVGDRFVADTGLEPPSWDTMITDLASDPTPYEEIR